MKIKSLKLSNKLKMMASSLKGSANILIGICQSNLSLNNEKWRFVCSKSKHSFKRAVKF